MDGIAGQIAAAEHLASHKGPKSLDAWVEISRGVHWLHEALLDKTEIEDDVTTNFMRDRAYRAAMDDAEKRRPTLISYMRNASRRRSLFWLEEMSSIQRWGMAHPELEKALADTTPEAIMALYLSVNGGEEWHPTSEQLAIVFEKEAAAEAKRKRMMGDVNERIRMAEDIVSYTPRPR